MHACTHIYGTLHYVTLHYTTLHYVTLHRDALQYMHTGVRSIHTTIPGRARPPGRKFWEQTKDCKRLTKMEVVRFTDDWAHGSCDANELTWSQRHERMNEWTNEWQKDCRKKGKIEWLSQRKKESVHEWMCEWMNAWMRNECMNEGWKEGRKEESMHQWVHAIDEPLNQWLNDWMNQWINESVNQWTFNDNEPMDLIDPLLLWAYHPLSATSLLGYNFRSFCNPILLVALAVTNPRCTTREGPPRENNLILWWVPTGSKLIYSGLLIPLMANLKPLNPPLALWPKSFSCSVTFGVHPPLQHVQIWNPAPATLAEIHFWRLKGCSDLFAKTVSRLAKLIAVL